MVEPSPFSSKNPPVELADADRSIVFRLAVPQLVRLIASRPTNAVRKIVRFTLRVPPEIHFSAIMSGTLGGGQEKTPAVTHQSHCRHRLLALCTKGGNQPARNPFRFAPHSAHERSCTTVCGQRFEVRGQGSGT